MPTAVSYFVHQCYTLADTARLPRFRPAWIAGSALTFLVGATWVLTGGTVAAQHAIRPLYPTTPIPVEMVDAQEQTVGQVIEGLPMGLRFEMLLKRTGAWGALEGTGPYTVFVPADNYFDYIEGGLPALTRAEERALALRHIVGRVSLVPTEETDGTYLTLAGQNLPASVGADGVVSVGDGFAIRGYYAQNGVVYVVSKVLVSKNSSS